MLRVLAVVAAFGALLLVAMATGRLDYIHSQLTAIRKPFNDVSAALTGPVQRGRAWDSVVKEANSICIRYEHEELVAKAALPRTRGAYVRDIRIELERERVTQAELAKLQPPPDYKGPYSQSSATGSSLSQHSSVYKRPRRRRTERSTSLLLATSRSGKVS